MSAFSTGNSEPSILNAGRIEAYLRAACAVLDFDIGEVWQTTVSPGIILKLKMIVATKLTICMDDFLVFCVTVMHLFTINCVILLFCSLL